MPKRCKQLSNFSIIKKLSCTLKVISNRNSWSIFVQKQWGLNPEFYRIRKVIFDIPSSSVEYCSITSSLAKGAENCKTK